MNTNKILVMFVMVTLLSSACVPTPATPPGFIPPTGPIGIISAEKTLVESGRSDNLTRVTNTADFYDSDTVLVTNGGVAELDISTGQSDNQISILIFNDTTLGNVKVDPSGTTDPFVALLLVFGGVTGDVPKNGGKPAQFTTPNGVNIYILGTQFLVLYDPETSTTYIGNFDGTVAYFAPGQTVQFTQAGQLYEISSNFQVKQSTLTFTRTDIENLTSNRRSTLLETLKGYLESTATPTLTMTPTTTPTMTIMPPPTACQPPSGWITYIVRSGDTLMKIASLYGTTVNDLQSGNCMALPTLIYPGQSIYVPNNPTRTPTPTKIVACDKALFVSDVTVPDGTMFPPLSQFTKTWRIKNVGTCAWSTAYSLDFYNGEQMAGKGVNIPSSVAPGQTVDISVELLAPRAPGSYRGEWILKNASGSTFGVGVNGTNPIWVAINVVIVTVTTPPIGSPDLTVSIASGPTATCDPKILTACIIISTVGFVITNASNTDATSRFQVLIEATGKQSSTITVNGLAAGSSQNFVQDFPGSCFSPDCTARVTVDSSNTILESNETNNVAENTVTGIRPGAITGTAFSDNNGNGIPDNGEVDQGLTVTLYDSTGSTALTATTTDAIGKYTFANLSPGIYYVKWDVPGCNGRETRQAPVNVKAGATQIQDLDTFVLC